MILNIERRGLRQDNTTGYTQQQLDDLNQELEKRLQKAGVETASEQYYDTIKQFQTEVARR